MAASESAPDVPLTIALPVVRDDSGAPRWTLLSSGVSWRLAGAVAISAGLWLAVAWALDWF